MGEGINCLDKLSECAIWEFHGTEPDFDVAEWIALSICDALGTDADRNRDLTNSARRESGRGQSIEQKRIESEELAVSLIGHEFERITGSYFANGNSIPHM
jgi:hypothetical protein